MDSSGVATDFDAVVGDVVRAFCSRDLRTRVLIGERLNPRNWPAVLRGWLSVPANILARHYEPLYESLKLAALPSPSATIPRFVFCATSVQMGACWQFHGGTGGRMGDFYTGYTTTEGVSVAEAVAASSAFPPGFGALRLRFPRTREFNRIDPWGKCRPESPKRTGLPQDRDRLVLLTDGGVYDNLGVEPVWRQQWPLLVSDAGHPFQSTASVCQSAITRLRRVIDISAEQVGAVRKRWLVEELGAKRRAGALWAIDTSPQAGSAAYDPSVRSLLADIRTDLNAFTQAEMCCLENHGYATADDVLRLRASRYCSNATATFVWPCADWVDNAKAAAALAKSARRNVCRDVVRFVMSSFASVARRCAPGGR